MQKKYLSHILFPLLCFLIVLSCSSNRVALYPVKIESAHGFINYKGELRVLPKYPQVQRYAEGFAPVQNSDGSLVYLNAKGREFSVSEQYGEVQKIDIFSEGLARVVVGDLVGYIDLKMNWVIPPSFIRAGRFSEGFVAVIDKEAQRGSFVDKQGVEVFSLEGVSALGPMKSSFAYFVRNERFGIVSREGKIVQEAKFLFLASADPNSGLARAIDDETELYGFVDSKGTWAILPQYPNASDFSGGYAAVFVTGKNRYGYINTRGKVRIGPSFIDAGNFHEGLAWVKTEKGYRYIDQQGEWLSPLIFSYTYDFYGKLAAAEKADEHFYLNEKGHIVWPNK